MDPPLSPRLTPRPQHAAVPAPHSTPRVATPQPVRQSLYSSQPAPAHPPTYPTHAPAAHASTTHAPAATQPNSVEQPMVPQIVAAFPVKQQDIAATQSQALTPAATPAAPSPNPIAQSEDDLDKILQAVNNRVKTPQKVPESKKKELGKKILSKTGKIKGKTKSSKPVGPMVVVVMVALMLSATAIFAYHEGNRTAIAAKGAGKVGTSFTASSSIQEAGGTLVNPADLDDYAQTLQTKLNSLNDSQDFSTTSLSDQVLGL